MAGMAAEYGMASLEARLREFMRAGQTPEFGPRLFDAVAADLRRTAVALREAFGIELV
jgi:hypothetical protein